MRIPENLSFEEKQKLAKLQFSVKCRIFYCNQRKGNYCCTYCLLSEECDDVCLNHPDKCDCTTKKFCKTKSTMERHS